MPCRLLHVGPLFALLLRGLRFLVPWHLHASRLQIGRKGVQKRLRLTRSLACTVDPREREWGEGVRGGGERVHHE